MDIFEEVFAKRAFSAGSKRGRDASDRVPEVRVVGVVAEDVDPYFWR